MCRQTYQQKFQKIRSNKLFELFVVAIIIFSALIIGVKTYPIPSYLNYLTTLLDWGITFFFLTEIIIRFFAEEHKKAFFKSGWNVFDSIIVLISLIPIDNTELALIGRLVRIFRVLRMISIIPELRIILSALIKAMPQLGYVMLLMFIIFYIYAAVGSTFFHTINPQLWGGIAISMLTLFQIMTFESWTTIMHETMEVFAFSWLYYISFIFFTTFAFLNMIIGIVVNVMEEERQKVYKKEQQMNNEPTLVDIQQQLDQIKVLMTYKKQQYQDDRGEVDIAVPLMKQKARIAKRLVENSESASLSLEN